MRLDQRIKQSLKNANFPHFAEGKAWKFFKKSEYYRYIKEEKNLNNVSYYSYKFGESIRFLNLF